jgi:hypothetical protein
MLAHAPDGDGDELILPRPQGSATLVHDRHRQLLGARIGYDVYASGASEHPPQTLDLSVPALLKRRLAIVRT